jgi:hypothetical protein
MTDGLYCDFETAWREALNGYDPPWSKAGHCRGRIQQVQLESESYPLCEHHAEIVRLKLGLTNF